MRVVWYWLLFAVAAGLEISGDAVIRKGLRSSTAVLIVGGVVLLGLYGILINTVRWDLSKLLGVYIAIFALISTAFGKFVLKENVPASTWIGVFVIVIGGLILQFGNK